MKIWNNKLNSLNKKPFLTNENLFVKVICNISISLGKNDLIIDVYKTHNYMKYT